MSNEMKPSPLRVIDKEATRKWFAAVEQKRSELAVQGQKLLARIRPESKYYGQGSEGTLFPVCIGPGADYNVLGGPGGQYRLSDVELFAVFFEDKPPVQITFAQAVNRT